MSITISTLIFSPSSWDHPLSIAAVILLFSSSSQAPSPPRSVDVSTCLCHSCACLSPLLSPLSIHLSIRHGSIHGSFIPDQTHLYISAHVSPSISSSWIHPSHSSQHTPISISPYSNISFFLVDLPITHPSQLMSISPSVFSLWIHRSQHTPISPSPYSSIHFCPCEFTHLIHHSSHPSLHLLSRPSIHPSLPGGLIHCSPTPADVPVCSLTPLHASHPCASTHLLSILAHAMSPSPLTPFPSTPS